MASRRQVYEDFQPKSELKEEQGAHLLLVHLPDFLKEQVRVIYVHSTRTIRVQGERLLGNNKSRRFNRTFPVPQNCIVEKINGKFQDGILTITMPKHTISPPPALPKEEGPKITPREKESSSSTVVPKPKLTVTEPSPPPREISGKDEIRTPDFRKPVIEPVKQSIQGDGLKLKEKEKKEDLLAPPKSPYEPKWRKSDENENENPDEDESEKETAKQRITESSKKLVTELAGKSADETEKPRILETKAERIEKEEVAAEKKAEKQGIVETGREGIKKLGTAAEIAALKALGKKKGVVGEEGKGKGKEEMGFVEKAKEMKNVATAAVKTAMEKKEDRQLIVNMGVAVLVIVAVGAYVTYKIRSKSKSD